ncbi:hypothetical protein [Pseudobdellovibrio exovorus]|uniref:Uncharacterized protein n=1 Tax=Pseudobdellovibrio exovorus JSS TaxID=1184267 RepID=M4VS23_9BACT|nr:hypothetical protein [Pseudobdellovibrio exovorus]AGH95974.1 hypothetical protein A11Q_1758 [Pseudobdellovibrio exovorus JSS]
MGYVVAIERDPKCFKEIQDSWSEVTVELNHEMSLFSSLADFQEFMADPDNEGKKPLLILITIEELRLLLPETEDLETKIQKLKELYGAEIMLSLFNDPVKSIKNIETLSVRNVLYKPFDLTILKEHTRFALLHGNQVKTQHVHTTQTETIIEHLKKFTLLEVSEFGFKITKKYPLEKNKAYKFYHPIFSHRKAQHIWARMINETDTHYELFFCQNTNAVLSQIRKHIAASKNKVKTPQWVGISDNAQTTLKIALQTDEKTAESIKEVLNRYYQGLTFINCLDAGTGDTGNANPASGSATALIEADVLITDIKHSDSSLQAQFSNQPLIIRLFDENLTRLELKPRLEVEYLRLEKPVDRSLMIKLFHLLFPKITVSDEVMQLTAVVNEVTALAEVIKIKEFSEAAMLFSDKHIHELGEVIEIALPQEDENHLQEVKGKVHFVSEKPEQDKLTLQQFVLFGMKDEYLKTMRLWSLQKHIEKNQKD